MSAEPAEQQKPPRTPGQRESLRTWVQFLRTYSLAQQRMSRVFSNHGLTSPQFDVLATLHGGEGIVQQELAERLLVTKGNICGVLDRLEAAGRIERRPDPEDRRANRIYLTDAGRQIFAETIPTHHELIYKLMANFQADELETLARLLKSLENAVEE